MKLVLLLILPLLLISIYESQNAYAEIPLVGVSLVHFNNYDHINMTVSTDKEAYYDYETVEITGEIDIDTMKSYFPHFSQILISFSHGYNVDLYKNIPVDVDENGKFYHEVSLQSLNDILSDSSQKLNQGSHGFSIDMSVPSEQDYTQVRFYIGDVEEYDRLNNWIDKEPLLTFENKTYTVNDTILFTGNTPRYTQPISIDIYNPNNIKVADLGFASDPYANFSKEFDLSTFGKSNTIFYPNDIINGTYTINAHHSYHRPSTSPFDLEQTFEFLHIIDKNHALENIIPRFNKEGYYKGDNVGVVIRTSEEYIDALFKVILKDPSNNILYSYEERVDNYKTLLVYFSAINFKTSGNYTMELTGEYVYEPLEFYFQFTNSTEPFQYTNSATLIQVINQMQKLDQEIDYLKNELAIMNGTIISLQSSISEILEFIQQLE